MKDGTRRVIEVQSDLYQRDRLESEFSEGGKYDDRWQSMHDEKISEYSKENNIPIMEIMNQEKYKDIRKDLAQSVTNELRKQEAKLAQYSNPTAHFRMVREEIAKAVKDGKKKLQFPTGETAMKIEGLTSEAVWEIVPLGESVTIRT